MSQKEQYVAKMESQLNEWSVKLATMKARLVEAEIKGRVEFHKQLDASQRQHEVACQHLDELKQSGEEAWEALKSGVELAWKELTSSITAEKK